MASSTASTTLTFRESVESRLENSWIQQLSAETEANLARSRKSEGLPETDSNRTKRPVFNGHYVLVKPSRLSDPRLVLYSSSTAQLLGFTAEHIESDDFTQFLAGNLHTLSPSWATPYALSIMGTRYTNNCPYGTGNGYGDGRAISIAEISSGDCSFELQLKGAGKTPFHRGADGRAVLRSSIREFLASEAMHFLGVSTTRPLSLIVSESDTIQRPWYSEADNSNNLFGGRGRETQQLQLPSMDDPRLAQYDDKKKKQIINQLRRTQKLDPNVMVAEPAAIACRVAPSFARIGHVDLFARRAEKANQISIQATKKRWNTDTDEWKELEGIIWHACYREYKETAYDPFIEDHNIEGAATALLHESAVKLAEMVAGWIRVGFAQGNFNADNCLIGGRTMDYGPFGWIEEYDPLFAKWTGSGQHFGFMNQPGAGYANYGVLVESVVPVIAAARGVDSADSIEQGFLEPAADLFRQKMDEALRVKMGFNKDQDVADEIWAELESLMRSSRVDWTVFFRELTYLARDELDKTDTNNEKLLQLLAGDDSKRAGSSPFYEKLNSDDRANWEDWLGRWRSALLDCSDDKKIIVERMLHTNPKFVLREWMLVDAYDDAARGQEAELFALHDLIQRPYGEGRELEVKKYYRRAPDDVLLKGGTAFMS